MMAKAAELRQSKSQVDKISGGWDISIWNELIEALEPFQPRRCDISEFN
jgi:hypothetical protein